MKIISYNVNGIRAALTKNFTEWLQAEDPDILCLQETKAQPDQIDTMLFAEMGYTSFLHSAEKKAWQGSKEDIFHVDNEDLNDFVFASNLYKKVKAANS